MKKNLSLKILAALMLVTAVLAAVHLTTRPAEEDGAVRITCNGKTVSVPLSELPLQDVSAAVVNGKGEEKTMEGKGIPLSEALARAGVDLTAARQVTVCAADEFSAVLTAREAAEEGRAWLMQEEGKERPRLIVTGDSDSRRQVKDVARIEVE